MQSKLSPKGDTDRSPLQFYRIGWLRGRVRDLYDTYLEYKRNYPVRVESNHLLIALLSNLTATFDGDLVSYMSQVESSTRRLAGALKLTTASVRGKLHEGVFYKGVTEVITVSSNNTPYIDLWWGWRDVSAVTVSSHPFTQIELMDPLVDGSPSITTDEIAYINIDVPILAAQYRMYRSSYPTGNFERFISQVVVPGMMKSHLDIVLFNKVLAAMDIIKPTKVRTNLPFAQPTLDKAGDDLAKEIVKGILNVPMTPTQLLNTIPTLYSDSTALVVMEHPDILTTQQSLWALHSQSVLKAKLVLTVAKERDHYDRLLPLQRNIRRNQVHIEQEGWYRNGLSRSESELLTSRWLDVISLLKAPGVSMESFDPWR